MSVSLRGIVEGFYGRPWTHDERLHLFDFMAEHGLNAYIYAPKDDELHRERWRTPYDEAALARFHTLVDAAAGRGILFTFAISPGLTLRYADPSELEALLAKVEPLLALGIRSIGVFFDDVPPDLVDAGDRERYGSLGEAQADFLARLQTRLPAAHLITVPTFYCGEPDRPYLHALGAMPTAIDVMWTGPAICSHTIRTEHLAEVAAVLRRPPVVWDNYPVNDAAMTPELHIGPYLGRDPDLPMRGLYANPMSLAEASKLPLATVAAYLADPLAYKPETAWRTAAQRLTGDLAEPLAVFAEAVSMSPLTPEPPAALRTLVAPFYANLLPFIHNPALDHLQSGVSRMRSAYERLAAARTASPLVAELDPWLAEYGRWIELLEAAVVFLSPWFGEERADGEALAAAAGARETIRQGLKEAVDFRTVVCGDVVRNFLQDLLRRSSWGM